MHRASLHTDHPVAFGEGTGFPISAELQKYGDKSGLGMALHPKSGKPWGFTLIQCSHARQWSDTDIRLFEEIGRRLSDGLTSLLSHQELQQSEEKYRRIVDTSNEGIWVLDSDTGTSFVNERMCDILGYPEEEILSHPFNDFMFQEDFPDHERRMENRRSGISPCPEDAGNMLQAPHAGK